MIDAAGAIYVIGGGIVGFETKFFNDVWVCTDGGVDRTRRVLGEGRTGYSQRGCRVRMGADSLCAVCVMAGCICFEQLHAHA